MKRLGVLLALTLPAGAFASSYLEEFNRLKASGDDAATRGFLEEAAKAEKANPDYYATAGNYWWQRSRSVNITTKPSEGDDISVRDKVSGKEVGSISAFGNSDPELSRKAEEILAEGVRRFPQRADIALGLAYVQWAMGQKAGCVATLIGLLSEAKKNPGALRWTGNGPLPRSAGTFIPEAVQEYSAKLYRAETPESDALCDKLCAAVIVAFPDHPYAYNIEAALASAQGNKREVLRYLELARSKAPDDAIVLVNLGHAYQQAGDNDKAKEAYARVISLDGADPSLKKQAQDALGQLAQPGGKTK